MWMEEKLGTRINTNRTEEAIATGAERIAIGCPFCRVMISDGLTAAQAGGVAESVEVVDVAQMLLAAVRRGTADGAGAGAGAADGGSTSADGGRWPMPSAPAPEVTAPAAAATAAAAGAGLGVASGEGSPATNMPDTTGPDPWDEPAPRHPPQPSPTPGIPQPRLVRMLHRVSQPQRLPKPTPGTSPSHPSHLLRPAKWPPQQPRCRTQAKPTPGTNPPPRHPPQPSPTPGTNPRRNRARPLGRARCTRRNRIRSGRCSRAGPVGRTRRTGIPRHTSCVRRSGRPSNQHAGHKRSRPLGRTRRTRHTNCVRRCGCPSNQGAGHK
jgi:hypothetical protein